MLHWKASPSPWPEADAEVWDRLGGRDSLGFWIGAGRFRSGTSFHRLEAKLKGETVSIRVQKAMCTYRGVGGRLRRLRVVESRMTGMAMPSIVAIDIQPAHWTLEWVLWILDPKGDTDLNRHRSEFHVGTLRDLSDDKLRVLVENTIGMSIDPFR